MTTNDSKSLEKIKTLIKKIDICMLTTVDEDGSLHSRPMSTNGKVEFDGDLWFFTYANTGKIEEIKETFQVNASFADIGNQAYVSMSGTAELVRNKEKMKELWLPELKSWFPKGLEEPEIALLKISVKKAEYWDGPSNLLAHAVSLVSSLMTAKPGEVGENERVSL